MSTVSGIEYLNVYEKAYENALAANEAWLMKITQQFNSTNEEELKAVIIGDTGDFEDWIEGTERGERRVNDYSLIFRKELFSDGFLIKASSYKANPSIFDNKARELGVRSIQKKQSKIIKWLNANPTCLSGLDLFSTTHVMGNSGTITNDISKVEVGALDVADPTKPTDIEASSILVGMIGYLRAQKDDGGLPSNNNANKFVLFVNTTNYESAFSAALTKEHLTGGETNQLFQLVANGKYQVDIAYEPNLTGSNKIVLANAVDGQRPFVFAEDPTEDISEFGTDSHVYKHKSAFEFALKINMAYAALMPQNILRGTLST